MHTLAFLEPGHFHASLTLREANPRVAPEVFVYATASPELDDFLARVERFNRRAERPTRWRLRVQISEDPLARLLDERPGDLVVLAGRNGGKARVIRRLHAAGLHVLADKPWLVDPGDLDDIRPSLPGPPIVRETMTGRRDAVARLVKRLVDDPDIFGGFVNAETPAIEQESVHHFEKRVDGAPLRRPWWYFDSRVQGGGAVDIPTHLVDQAQWLLDATGRSGEAPRLLTARGWSTHVPIDVFRRVSGAGAVPPALRPIVEGDALRVFCNAELTYALAGVTARAAARWEIATPPGGGDTSRVVLRGRSAEVSVEQSAGTQFRRRVSVVARGDARATERALGEALAAARTELPGVEARRLGPGIHELVVPPALDAGHEAHFAELLDELLGWIDAREWPAAVAERTLAKYTLLAEAAAATSADDAARR
ncbi:MAG TPA: putative oxidoreductase C-terminal domain-containing protein [Candidatus Nitrosotalea sp.]|nr:putative oxidoreductase C-terminal domain-containing protein [Candidatus Nitrosotalea sp.]